MLVTQWYKGGKSMKLFKVIVKSLEDNYYGTPYVSQLYHKGDIITIDHERFVVIGGDVLPKI